MENIELLPNEKWTAITDKVAPGVLPYYAISNYGRIYHTNLQKFMSLSWDGPGYVIAVLRTINGSKTFRVHRLVMLTFRYFDGCEAYLVDHINGDKTQNWIDVPFITNPVTQEYELRDNLRWCTAAENSQFYYDDSPESKFRKLREESEYRIDKNTAIKICELLAQGMTVTDVMKATNTSYNVVICIKNGYSWREVSEKYIFPERDPKRKTRSLTDEQAEQICKLLVEGKSSTEISKELDISRSIVTSILRRECYTDISNNYKF